MKTACTPKRTRRSAQRGLASLVVVMVLFGIVAMVAAYTNRNLIFEQRTSLNQYRSTQALEAAEAGLEWAKALLNSGRINASCQPSTATTDNSFRQRYLSIDADGLVTPVANPNPPASPDTNALTAACVRNGTGWACSCPVTGVPTPTTSGDSVNPAFRVRFIGGQGQAGVVRLEVNGCTRFAREACLNFLGTSTGGGAGAGADRSMGLANDGRVLITELISLASGLPSPPVAALTAGGNVNLGGAAARLANGHVPSGGWTVHTAGTVAAAGLQLESLPGTPGSLSLLENDGQMPTGTDRLFASVFNMWPDTFRSQPGLVVLDATTTGCTASGCTAAAVRTASQQFPGLPIWVAGNLEVDSTGDIGSASEPVVVVVNGDLTFSAGGATTSLFGVVFVRKATWTTAGAGLIRGAVIAQGAVAGDMTTQISYAADVVKRARLATGSFVRIPGGWKDYCTGAANVIDCR